MRLVALIALFLAGFSIGSAYGWLRRRPDILATYGPPEWADSRLDVVGAALTATLAFTMLLWWLP